MWCVGRPQFDATETYALCISRVQNERLKRRLEDISEDIAEAAAEYAQLAGNNELHLIPQANDVAGIVTKDEMVAIYEGRMAKMRGPARRVYDALRSLPEYGICPFCDHGVVSTLDHILPKALCPALAVAPDNLVGSCKESYARKLVTA